MTWNSTNPREMAAYIRASGMVLNDDEARAVQRADDDEHVWSVSALHEMNVTCIEARGWLRARRFTTVANVVEDIGHLLIVGVERMHDEVVAVYKTSELGRTTDVLENILAAESAWTRQPPELTLSDIDDLVRRDVARARAHKLSDADIDAMRRRSHKSHVRELEKAARYPRRQKFDRRLAHEHARRFR